MTLQLDINADRLNSELDRLAEFSDVPAPAVTRVMLSEADLNARHYLCGLFVEAGLRVRADAAGNLFARWVGEDDSLPAVGTGSHCDAIPHSGKYDGTVGVLGGLEAVRALQQAGWRPRRSIDVIMFTSEEPTRYGVGCLGSRLLAGKLSPQEAALLRDSADVAFDELRQNAGCDGQLADVQLADDAYASFVELHIEQGPLLEQAELPIGVVTHIAAPAALRVEYQGAGGHAGAVLMPQRRDALLPAAELALAVRQTVDQLGGEDTVATTGVLQVHPGAVNSIPSRTQLEIDIRDIQLARRDAVVDRIRETAQAIGDRHEQTTSLDLINADPPATCDARVVDAIQQATNEAGLDSMRMISRAYHDSLFMAQQIPTGMIFIPCRDGVSHRPDEYASPAAMAAGVEVLARSLHRLAGE